MTIETPEHALQAFSTPVFKIRIKIGSPCGSLSISRKDDRADVIKANGGKSTDTLPIYQVFEVTPDGSVVYDSKGKPQVAFSAKQCQTQLSNALDALQEKYMLASGDKGLWYCPSSKIEELDKELKELEVLRDDLCDQLTTSKNYHKAKGIYEQALYDALDPDEVDQHISKFPAINEITEKFRIEVIEWEPLKSIDEILEKSDDDASKQRQIEAVQRVIEDLQSKAPEIISECYGLFARLLDLVEHQKLVDEAELWNKSAERVSVLLELWKSSFSVDNTDLKTMAADLAILPTKAKHTTDSADIEELCNEIRAKWRTAYKLGHSEGAIKLTEWLYPERGLESQINTLIQQIKDELDEAKRQKLEKKLHTKKDLLLYKVDQINQQIKFILGDVESLQLEAETEVVEPATDLATHNQLRGLTVRLLKRLYKPYGDTEGLIKDELIENLLAINIKVSDIDGLKDSEED